MTPKIRVQPNAFETGTEIAEILEGRTDIGGIGCFVGTVRGTTNGQPIQAMTLEHYPGMTERALTNIATNAATRWPLLACTLIHRIGRLVPGEPIVLVLTASPHRQAALDATAYLIDWLKTAAPFWKKEDLPTGESLWVQPRKSDTEAQKIWTKPAK